MSEHAIHPSRVTGAQTGSAPQNREPFHVAVIMDGNGRWAQRRGLPRIAGHRAGSKAVRRCVEAAPDTGITTLTLYAFSSDNWNRPAKEVRSLMKLLRDFLHDEAQHCLEKGVRVSVIGRRDRLSDEVVRAIEHCESITADANLLHLRIAVDYSARFVITQAARQADGDTDLTNDEFLSLLNKAMHSPECPPVDLLIRTSGEKRLSDFMLWECAYSELDFIDAHWPEFNAEHLHNAVREFRGRDRRFGCIAEAG